MEASTFSETVFRAGHGHAGILIILGLICLMLTEATSLTGFWEWSSRAGVLVSAILIPAGFFLSALGPGRTAPNRLIVLLWGGAGFLVTGLISCGVGLILAA
ncbi:hypothetical protein ACFP47_08095 [Nesterenkonia lacusekhoensis]|uniref:Uncharacterized protein n=1 Tax=Nesterenkonia lacusekhoensis TaxID=150832 RepID=A0ABS4T1N1_9MICC|nr:hypothetical protein [Nesterenkonia lacusekhoensis]MBP2318362.1 hypothetical protein [Nesterenkonia lacusekhoensis]